VHSCIIDKAGKYVWMSEYHKSVCTNTHGRPFSDSVMGIVATGETRTLCNVDGGGGHRAIGYGELILNDNQADVQGARRLWNLDQPFLPRGRTLGNGETQGGIVWRGPDWRTHPSGTPSHESWMHAKPNVPLNEEFVCGASATKRIYNWHGDHKNWGTDWPFNGSVICFGATTQHADVKRIPTLVVAPAMSIEGTRATRGLTDYNIQPKGVMDPTGNWFIFTSDHGADRTDLFMVKVPARGEISAPAEGAGVSGKVMIKAATLGGVKQVLFRYSSAGQGTHNLALVKSPTFQTRWDTRGLKSGAYIVSAVVYSGHGNGVDSEHVHVTVTKRN
jgi:hypothetical protein